MPAQETVLEVDLDAVARRDVHRVRGTTGRVAEARYRPLQPTGRLPCA